MEAIEIKNLKEEYKNLKLNIEGLRVREGFITGFIGPSGSGKTTTIEVIMNMIKCDEGEILALGKNISEDPKIKESIGFIGDVCGFLEESKLKNIKLSIARFYRNWDEELHNNLINKFNLDGSSIYEKLSKEQKKQLELAMALSIRPKITIMDESTASLDPIIRSKFLEILQEGMEKENLIISHLTHVTSDLERCADYVILIYRGKIILYGEKGEILEQHSVVKGKKELLDNETRKYLISIKTNGFGFGGLTSDKKETFEIPGSEVIYEKPILEDIVFYYTRRN